MPPPFLTIPRTRSVICAIEKKVFEYIGVDLALII